MTCPDRFAGQAAIQVWTGNEFGPSDRLSWNSAAVPNSTLLRSGAHSDVLRGISPKPPADPDPVRLHISAPRDNRRRHDA